MHKGKEGKSHNRRHNGQGDEHWTTSPSRGFVQRSCFSTPGFGIAAELVQIGS
jgi:hypothetical protein